MKFFTATHQRQGLDNHASRPFEEYIHLTIEHLNTRKGDRIALDYKWPLMKQHPQHEGHGTNMGLKKHVDKVPCDKGHFFLFHHLLVGEFLGIVTVYTSWVLFPCVIVVPPSSFHEQPYFLSISLHYVTIRSPPKRSFRSHLEFLIVGQAWPTLYVTGIASTLLDRMKSCL